MADVLARLRLAGRDWPPLTSALLGEAVSVEVIFTSVDGSAIEAGSVTAVAYRPALAGEDAGTTPAIALTRMSVGVWSGALQLDRVGDWAIDARCATPSIAVARADLRVTLGGPEALEDSRGAASAGHSASLAQAAANAAAIKAAEVETARAAVAADRAAVAQDRQDVLDAAETVEAARAEVSTNRGLVAADRIQTGLDRAAAATSATQAGLSAAQAASTVANAIIARDTLAQLQAVTPVAQWQQGTVNADGANNGTYRFNGAAWERTSTATLASVSAKLDAGGYEEVQLSVFSTRAAIPADILGVDATPGGLVVAAFDAEGNLLNPRVDTLEEEVETAIYTASVISAFSTRGPGPVDLPVRVDVAADGTVFEAYDEAGSPLSLRLEQARAEAAEAALSERIDVEVAERVALGDDLRTEIASIAEAIAPFITTAASPFSDAYMAAVDDRLVVEAIATQNRPLGFLLNAPADYNVSIGMGQSISHGVAATGHSSILSWPIRSGVLMQGTAERCASTTLTIWEAMGSVVKNDDLNFNPLRGTLRVDGGSFPNDGSPPITGDAVNAIPFDLSINGESPFVNALYEARGLRNRHLGRAETTTDAADVLMNVGIGSTRIAWWLYGAAQNYFNRAETAAVAAETQAGVLGGTCALGTVFWYQGVSDSSLTSYASYKAALVTLRADITTRIEAGVFSQARPAALLLYSERQTSPGFELTAPGWSSATTYAEGAVVALDYHFYRSLQAANLNNTPASSPSFWLEIFCRYGYDATLTYDRGEYVYLDDGRVMLSLSDDNATDPASHASWAELAGSWSSGGLQVQTATLDFCREEPTAFLVGPGYPVVNRATHYGLNGSKWLGSYAAKVRHHVMTLGRDWLPTHIKEARWRGDEVLLLYHAPIPQLGIAEAYDYTYPRILRDYGLRIYDDTDPLLITDGTGATPASAPYHPSRGVKGITVEIVGRLLIRITAPRTLVGTVRVSYADPGLMGGLGNIADTDPAVAEAIYGYVASPVMDVAENRPELVGKPYPLRNFAVPQLITAVEV